MTERDIFLAAVDITDPKARQTYLDHVCGNNNALKASVMALLASHEGAGSFLGTPLVHSSGSTSSHDTAVDEVSSSSAAIEKTVQLSHEHAAEFDDENCSDEHEIPLGYLAPSQKPGVLGRLAHYEVLEVLGKGAFGTVLKAFDEKLHRMVAIKVMSIELASTSPARKRFLREARASAAIRHDNVVAIYAVEEQPIPYLVMEYIPGKTLADALVGEGPLELNDTLRLGQQIASGLAAAHSQGLIHRDIKPANILLEDGIQWKVKITDFGLARAADDASVSQSGTIAGTPMYMSPEQALSSHIDQRSDLFSFGSVMYQMVSGRPPFRAASTLAVMKRVTEDTPRPIQEIIPEVPDWLVIVISKLHAKKPEDRYQTAQEVADLLGKCQGELQLTGQVTCVSASSTSAASAPENAQRELSGREKSVVALPADSRPASSEKKQKAKQVVLSLMLGLLMVSPVLYGRHVSRVVSGWFWGPIPSLPVNERMAGLRFDGDDDFVQVPVTWDLPQFTIEAFVTAEDADVHRTLVELSNYGSGTKDERIQLFDALGQNGERLSFAAVQGRQGSLNAYGPRLPGVREHRAIVCDGQELNYYINGVWQGKRNNQPQDELLWRMRWLTIGSQHDRKKFFRGEIDQLRVSKVARYQDNFPAVSLVSSDDATLALYNFDEGHGDLLKDVSGNGNDAKISGATWIYPAQGLQFDGVDDYVEFQGLDWNSNRYTIEAYISQDGGHGNIVQTEGPGGMLHMYLFPKGGGAGINRDQVYANANGPRPSKIRQHLAVVYDGENLNYFVQGQLAGTKTNVSAEATPMSLERMIVGAKLHADPSKPEFFEGRLEQLRVSRTVRYVLPFKPDQSLGVDADTLGLYDFTTGDGAVVKDVSGRSSDGNIIGATWVRSSEPSK